MYRGAIISNLSADTAQLSDMPVCTVQLYQTCMLGSFIQIRVLILSVFIFFISLQAKCFQSDPNFIATNLRKK